MQDVPVAPSSGPVRVSAITSGTTMGVSYSILSGTDTRGSNIVSYSLEIDNSNGGAGPFTILGGYATDSLLT